MASRSSATFICWSPRFVAQILQPFVPFCRPVEKQRALPLRGFVVVWPRLRILVPYFLRRFLPSCHDDASSATSRNDSSSVQTSSDFLLPSRRDRRCTVGGCRSTSLSVWRIPPMSEGRVGIRHMVALVPVMVSASELQRHRVRAYLYLVP